MLTSDTMSQTGMNALAASAKSGSAPAPEFAEEKEQGEQDHPAADYHRHMHNQPSGNAFYTSPYK